MRGRERGPQAWVAALLRDRGGWGALVTLARAADRRDRATMGPSGQRLGAGVRASGAVQ
jgi:hypothetical protein